MPKGFLEFLKAVAHRLRGMANKLRGDFNAKDLQANVWFAAEDVSKSLGRPVEFDSPADRELILNRVFWDAKSANDWRLKAADSIDDDSDGKIPWSERLSAPTLGPLEELTRREQDGKAYVCSTRYSQYAAYGVAVRNFNFEVADLCSHLSISTRALTHRVDLAKEVQDRQNSIFDGIINIEPSFAPLARSGYVRGDMAPSNGQQLEMFE